MSKYKSLQLFKPLSQGRCVLEADDKPINVVQIGCFFSLLVDKWNNHGKKIPCLKEPYLFLLCFGRTTIKYEDDTEAISVTGLERHVTWPCYYIC